MNDLAVQHDGKVSRLCLDRPQRRNALDRELMRALLAALDDLPTSTEIVVVEANGPVFSAGHDLSEMVAEDADFYDELFDICTRLMLALHATPHPVVAKVQGGATAAGCQ